MSRAVTERRKKVWELMKRGVSTEVMAEVLGVRKATVVCDQVALRVASRYGRQIRFWSVGDRIRLTRDGWGKMPAGTFGTVLKVFHTDGQLAPPDYGVMWDTGVKDCVDASTAERLSPLEQLGSVCDDEGK